MSFLLALSLPLNLSAATNVVETDICVYGGTSGGVIAAVTAARLGKSVSLLAFNNHVGGMSSGGLGVTDRGNTASIGGLSREFYLRVGQHYGSSNAVYFFEPHVAKQTFQEMLNEAGVSVYNNQRLASVTIAGQRISQITMEDGTIYRAKMFIDTTYEGDLMADAGVSFMVGREGTNIYNESLAGIRPLGGSYDYDPYIIPGNPASGLLPFVQSGTNGILGQGDNRVQAYNFRLCLTQNPTNQIPIAPPSNYTESQYELFARYIEARVAKDGSVALNQLIDLQTIIPNGKTDINANGELSTDFVGFDYTYPTNTYAEREVIRQQHEDYTRGFLYFLATSTHVPLNVRTNMQTWQLAKDEFRDTGGWPHQLYVREARRMISDYVMIQQDADGRRSAPDSIALASYTLDSHGYQRLASSGFSRWEGSLGSAVPFPFGISYRSIIPRVGECQNLFCTFALSASHVAYSSVRMEPVFMMTSQSAATAAAFAIDDNVPVQQVNYQRLSAGLRADGQILQWVTANNATNGVIVDQSDAGTWVTGSWSLGANAGGWNANYFHDGASGKGQKSVRYTPNLPTNGTYEVYLWWVSDPNRATNTPVDIVHAAGTNRVLVNQRLNSGGWYRIFSTNFNAGTGSSVIIRNDNTASGSYVIADGVRWLPVGNAVVIPPPVVEIVASDALAGEFGDNTGRFSLVRNGGDTNLPPLQVNYTIGGSAGNGVDYVSVPGTTTIPSGALSANIIVSPFTDNLTEGDETVTLALSPLPSYTLGSASSAVVVIKDRPIDEWRRNNFTAVELGNAQVSEDLADPDHDGLSNLMEYALGLSPKSADANILHPRIENGSLILNYTKLKSATDIAITLERSADLNTWQVSPGDFEQEESLDTGTTQSLTVRAATSINSANRFFVRLKVTRL